MPYARKIILHTPLVDPAKLDSFVEACLADGVVLVAVVGPEASLVDDLIDEIVVGDGSDPGRIRKLTTTLHPDEPLAEVLDFVASWPAKPDDRIEQVRF
ncbi:hypothetical protein [Bradyrhizobium sp. USDA 4353]